MIESGDTYKIIYSDKTTINRIGLGFFKDYRVILNWNKKRIKIIENQSISKDTYSTFGYSIYHEDNQIVISSLVEGSSASKHLEIGDIILTVNNRNISPITESERCKIWQEGIVDKLEERINISVLRNEKVYNFHLDKKSFF